MMSELKLTLERLATPTGTMLLVSDGQNRLRGLDWEDHADRLNRLVARYAAPQRVCVAERQGPSAACRALAAYFAGDLAAIDDLPVETGGTPFQRRVWAALRCVPTGETTSYGTLAADIGSPKAVRAVGLANGANPVCIVVPCHRVIGADASLTGYGGGLPRKRWLLDHEGARWGEKGTAGAVEPELDLRLEPV
jgi:methylated-DNA-[protein]-cysteine S-methyltransferase